MVVVGKNETKQKKNDAFNQQITYKLSIRDVFTIFADCTKPSDPAVCAGVYGASVCCQADWHDVFGEADGGRELQ